MADQPHPIPWGILVSATRYALGRGTYVTGETADVLVAQAPLLQEGPRDILIRDIEWHLDLCRGSNIDNREWRRALDALKQAAS